MRSPNADTAAPPFAVGGGFVGEYFREVVVGNEEVGHGNVVVVGYGGGGCPVGMMMMMIVVI